MSDSFRAHELRYTRHCSRHMECSGTQARSSWFGWGNRWLTRSPVQKIISEHADFYIGMSSVQFGSAAQSCPTLCDPMNSSMPGLPVHHQLPEFLKLMSIESVMPSSHLILCHPLLLLPPIPPSIRVFSNESNLHMRWPKYWSHSEGLFPRKYSLYTWHLR